MITIVFELSNANGKKLNAHGSTCTWKGGWENEKDMLSMYIDPHFAPWTHVLP